MTLNPKRFYWLLLTSCIAGYLWLYFSTTHSTTMCLMKNITGLPCPSCGSTRSVAAIFKGNWSDALYWNPIGILVFVIMIAVPIWMTYDALNKKMTLWSSFLYIENRLRKKAIAIPLILLIVANWIWNIFKHL